MSELGNALRRAMLSASPDAEDRAVRIVRQEVRGGQQRRSQGTLLPKLAVASIALLLLALSPPGQSAVSWAAELIGIGEVGGPPSNEQRPAQAAPAGDQVVIANGAAPDGTKYEVVAYRTDETVAGEADRGSTCIFVDFPGLNDRTTGACGDRMIEHGRSLFVSGVSGANASGVPANPVLTGYVSPDVAEVTVRSTGSDASKPAELVVIDKTMQQRMGADEEIAFFFRFLPAGFDVAGLSSGTEHIEVTAYGRGGEEIDQQNLPDAQALGATQRAQERIPPRTAAEEIP